MILIQALKVTKYKDSILLEVLVDVAETENECIAHNKFMENQSENQCLLWLVCLYDLTLNIIK